LKKIAVEEIVRCKIIQKAREKMEKSNTKFNAFLEELEALICRYREDIGSTNGLSTETPPEDIFTYAPVKEGIGVAIAGIRCSEDNIPAVMRIPERISGEPVTGIKMMAFPNNRHLKSITVPGCVEYIGQLAFVDCPELTNVTIENGVKEISHQAFAGCKKLSVITIPDSVNSFGVELFMGCRELKNISIPDGVCYIQPCTFLDCIKLERVKMPRKAEKILHSAFSGCVALAELSLPESLIEIGEYAFLNCKSLSGMIEFPDSLTEIDPTAFQGCSDIDGAVYRGKKYRFDFSLSNFPNEMYDAVNEKKSNGND